MGGRIMYSRVRSKLEDTGLCRVKDKELIVKGECVGRQRKLKYRRQDHTRPRPGNSALARLLRRRHGTPQIAHTLDPTPDLSLRSASWWGGAQSLKEQRMESPGLRLVLISRL
jgi:hypothetical protein